MTSFFDIVSDQQMAWVNEQQRGWQRMMSLPRVAQLATETKVGASAHDVVFETGTLRLLRYRRSTPATYAEPVLFCYALINRHYILDLQADKSVVQRYIDRGFDVYMIDWGVPADSDHGLTLRDYVEGLLKIVVDFILERHDRRDLHLLGYCMGGTLAVLFASLLPERVKSLTLMAAPIDFGRRETLLSLWTDPQYFDVDSLIDRYGNCPAPFLQSCFLLMKPVQNVIEKYVTFYEQLDDSRFVSNYFAMEHWVNDNIPVAGETFRTFVKSFFQKNELVRGEFLLGREARRSVAHLLSAPDFDGQVRPPGGTCLDRGDRAVRQLDRYRDDGNRCGARGPRRRRKSAQGILAQSYGVARREIVATRRKRRRGGGLPDLAGRGRRERRRPGIMTTRQDAGTDRKKTSAPGRSRVAIACQGGGVTRPLRRGSWKVSSPTSPPRSTSSR